MPIPHPDPETEDRLRRDDLGLPPDLSARLDARPDLARALATAMRLTWSREPWARRQGEELCRALATTDPDARAVLLAPLAPVDTPGTPRARVVLTDGPWLPLETLSALARAVEEHASAEGGVATGWGPAVSEVRVAATASEALPPPPPGLRSLAIDAAPFLRVDDSDWSRPLGSLSVTGAPGAEPWSVAVLPGHRGWVRAIAIPASGGCLATGGADATVRIWEPLPEEDAPRPVAGSAGSAARAVLDGHARPVTAIAAAPRTASSRTAEFASASVDGTVRVWRERAGRWHEHAVLVHGDRSADPAVDGAPEVADVAWSPDGTRLATACDDGEARVWSVARDGWRPELLRGPKGSGHAGGPVRRVAWAPDGLRVATAGADGTVRLWVDDGTRFTEAGVVARFTDWVRALSWSPDGTSLAAASDDATAVLLRFAGAPRALAARRRGAPPRKVIARTALVGHEGWIRSLAFDAGSARVATTADDGVLRVFPVDGESSEPEVGPFASVGHGVRITAAAWSPVAPEIATGDDAGVLRVVRVVRPDGACETVEGHGEGEEDGGAEHGASTIGALAWSPAGREVWTGSDDHLVRVWRPSTTGLGPAWRLGAVDEDSRTR